MTRLLVLFGPILSLMGAVGLFLYGGAIAEVFGGTLTLRSDESFENLASSLTELRWAAISSMGLSVGLAVSCIAIVRGGSQKQLSLAGRVLSGVAGILIFFGAMTMAWVVFDMRAGFFVIAMSGGAPTPDDVSEIVQATSPRTISGCIVLLLGVVALFAAGQVVFRRESPEDVGRRSALGMVAAAVSVVLGVVSCLLFIVVWLHSNELGELLGSAAKPNDLARQLSGILNSSFLAFLACGGQGIMQVVAAVPAGPSMRPIDKGRADGATAAPSPK